LEEVRSIIDRKGIKHLSGMYRVDWYSQDKKAVITELKLIPSYEINEKEKDAGGER